MPAAGGGVTGLVSWWSLATSNVDGVGHTLELQPIFADDDDTYVLSICCYLTDFTKIRCSGSNMMDLYHQ